MKNILFTIFIFLTLTSVSQNQLKKIIFFEPNQSTVSVFNKLKLDSLIERVANKDYEITLIGRADSIGSKKLNLYLSEKRANYTATYLNKKGIDKMKITTLFLGEANPLFSNTIKQERVKNRCVEIIVAFNNNNLTLLPQTNNDDSTNYVNTKFENDTVIILENGTQIEITAETFYPIKIKDINFNTTEIFSLCDMLNNNTVTRAANGDCLTSAGMLYIKPTYDGVEVQPNKGKFVKIKIPTKNGQLDKSMTLYGGVEKKKNGEIIWKNIKSELSYQENGIQYYLFKIDTLYAFNLDKPLGIKCNKDGPKIKVRKFKGAFICQTYPNEKYLAVAEQLKPRKFALDKLLKDKKPTLTVIVNDKLGNPYLAKGALHELKYRKWNNTYIIKKKYFKRILRDYTKQMNPNDYMCNYLE